MNNLARVVRPHEVGNPSCLSLIFSPDFIGRKDSTKPVVVCPLGSIHTLMLKNNTSNSTCQFNFLPHNMEGGGGVLPVLEGFTKDLVCIFPNLRTGSST